MTADEAPPDALGPPATPAPSWSAPAGPARHFRRWVTVLAAAAVAVSTALHVLSLPMSPLDQLSRPADALARVVRAEMLWALAFDDLGPTERRLWRLLGAAPDPPERLADRHAELGSLRQPTESRFVEEVLRAEAGRRAGPAGHAVRGDCAGEWAAWGAKERCELLAFAYGEAGRPSGAAIPDMGTITRLLSPSGPALCGGWCQGLLTLRVAERLAPGVGDEIAALAGTRRAELRLESRGLLWRLRGLTLVHAALLAAAVAALVGVARRPRVEQAREGGELTAPVFRQPWGLGEGLALAVRGGAAFVAVVWLESALAESDSAWGQTVSSATSRASSLWAALALVWWTSRLAAARGSSLGAVVGWPGSRGLVRWALACFGISAAGDITLALGRRALGWESHWAEGLLDEVFWLSPSALVGLVVDAVVWAPVFEELLFRGALYGALRARLPAAVAAVASAGVFAVLHGYSGAGTLSVFVSGLVWALARERTGSLLPGMVAHALNNALASAGVLLLLR